MTGLHCDFHRGDTVTMNYTPSSALAAGEVKIVEQILGITHRAIAANELGALHIGGGEYTFIGDAVIAVGKPIYWDATAEKATETAAGNKYLGLSTSACAADGSEFWVARTMSGDVEPGSGG